MTALFIRGHKGERGETGWGGERVYSQQQGDAHPLYDSYGRYRGVLEFQTEISAITAHEMPNSARPAH